MNVESDHIILEEHISDYIELWVETIQDKKCMTVQELLCRLHVCLKSGLKSGPVSS